MSSNDFLRADATLLDEHAVGVLDRRLQDLLRLVVQRAIQAQRVRQRRRADAVDRDAELAERALDGRKDGEHADRAGQRRRARPDLVGIHRDVVAAGRGDAAHRGDDRLAGLAQRIDLATNHFGGEHAAAGAVDAQHDGLDRRRRAAPRAAGARANPSRSCRAAARRRESRRTRRRRRCDRRRACSALRRSAPRPGSPSAECRDTCAPLRPRRRAPSSGPRTRAAT